MNKHKFIFIGGLHRSGTWLQTHSLEDHPQISLLGSTTKLGAETKKIKSEGQFLQTIYSDDHYYGGVGRFGFHPEAHLTEASSLITDKNRRKMFDEWKRYWDLNKPILLEKTPSNLIRSRFLQAMFPNSYFIFIMRHPVPVALAQQKWTGIPVSSLIEHWLICYEMLREDLKHLNNYVSITYEDFIAQPEKSLNKIHSFLDVEPHMTTQVVRSDGNDNYFETWKRALAKKGETRGLSHKIIKRFMPYATRYGYPVTILSNEVDMVIQRYESRVNEFGYSLIDL